MAQVTVDNSKNTGNVPADEGKIMSGTTEENFQNRMNNTYGKDSTKFSSTDFDFLRYMRKLYGDVLSAKGLNLIDPIYANIFHYNKMQNRSLVDPPQVTRTYVFFTRPELNFSFENINAIPFFKWLYSKPIGKMIMAALTDPEYFINAPAIFNASSNYPIDKLIKAAEEFAQLNQSQTGELFKNADASDLLNENGAADWSASRLENYEKEEANAQKELESAVGDIDALNSEAEDKFYTEFVKEADKYVKNYNDLFENYKSFEQKADELEDELEKSLQFKPNGTETNVGDTLLGLQAKRILQKTHNGKYDKFYYTTPWIPLLQNTCKNVSGAKDFSLTQFQYGVSGFNVASDMEDTWVGGSFNASFEDIQYGPVSLLFMLWELYIHYVSKGYIAPTRQHVTEKILDYTCSCYIMVIGPDGRNIERFGRFLGCWPSSFPFASQLEFNSTNNPEMLKDISITFNYTRFEPMDPQILMDFNFLSETEWLFKLNNWDTMYYRDSKLPREAFLDRINNRNRYTVAEIALLTLSGRDPRIWSVINEDQQGMSGKVPRALIAGTDIDSENDLSTSDLINNYWGGYPYINNGHELLWVRPTWNNKSFNRDKLGDSGSGTSEHLVQGKVQKSSGELTSSELKQTIKQVDTQNMNFDAEAAKMAEKADRERLDKYLEDQTKTTIENLKTQINPLVSLVIDVEPTSYKMSSENEAKWGHLTVAEYNDRIVPQYNALRRNIYDKEKSIGVRTTSYPLAMPLKTAPILPPDMKLKDYVSAGSPIE